MLSKADLIIITTDSDYYPSVLNLREEVLRKPIGLTLTDEDISKDYEQFIFVAIHERNVIACLMAVPLNGSRIKFRQMAVSPACQGQHIGSRLLQFAESFCKEKGFLQLELNARKSALDFYLKNGYSFVGDEFLEVGIPHKKMQKFLEPVLH